MSTVRAQWSPVRVTPLAPRPSSSQQPGNACINLTFEQFVNLRKEEYIFKTLPRGCIEFLRILHTGVRQAEANKSYTETRVTLERKAARTRRDKNGTYKLPANLQARRITLRMTPRNEGWLG